MINSPEQVCLTKSATGYILSRDEAHRHHFQIESTINTSFYPQGVPSFVSSISTHDLSQFAIAAREGLSPESLDQNINLCRNPKIRTLLIDLEKHGQMYPIDPSLIRQKMVFHAGASIFVDKQVKPIDKLEKMKDTGVYGGDLRVSYFGLELFDALNHGMGNYNQVTNQGRKYPQARIMLLTINLKRLAEKRNIFRDPESLLPAFEHEFNSNFVVHSGIPVSAIDKLEILKYEGIK